MGTISVLLLADPLVIPRIALDQYSGVYITGEAATLTCTSLGPYSGSPFTFYRNNNLLTRTDNGRRWARLRIDHIAEWDRGAYTCRDSNTVFGREVQSQHSNPVEVTVTDPITRPETSLDQPSGVYLEGATVTITCTVTGQYVGEVFYFYRESRMLSSRQIFSKHNIGTFMVTGTSQGGRYECRYGTSVNGRWLWSQLSESVWVTVTAYPHKPALSTNRRERVFEAGETVLVTCQSPAPYLGSRFFLYRRGQNAPIRTDTAMASQSRVTFNITNLLGIGSEYYWCVYKNTVSEREVISERSDTMKVTVVDPLTAPVISLDQPSGVYSPGDTVVITCALGREHHSPIFFYKDNKLLSSRQIFTKDNIATFPITSMEQAGRYQCQYETFSTTRRLLSQPSETVVLTVADSLTPPVISLDQPAGVYLQGEAVTITCTVNRKYRGKIDLYRNSELLSSRELFTKDNMRTFTVTGPNQGGRYQCKYSASVKTRWLESQLSQAVTVTVVDLPTPPEISLDQPTGVYLEGEAVTITCMVKGEYRGIIYLYRDNQMLNSCQLFTPDKSGTFLVTGTNQAGRYQCTYGTYTKTRWLESLYSEAVTVTTVEALTAPRISLDQSVGVYLRGETVTLTCTVSTEPRAKIYFYKDNELLTSRQLFTKDNIGTFTVTSAYQGGRYQCRYRGSVKRRRWQSQLSKPVTVTIAGAPKPLLSVNSSVVVKGEKVTFNCTSPVSLPGFTFYLYKHGEFNYSDVQPAAARSHSVNFTITEMGHADGGNYTCLYKADGKRRLLTSALSEPVQVTVRDKFAGLEAGVGSALALMLLLALMGVCFWKRDCLATIQSWINLNSPIKQWAHKARLRAPVGYGHGSWEWIPPLAELIVEKQCRNELFHEVHSVKGSRQIASVISISSAIYSSSIAALAKSHLGPLITTTIRPSTRHTSSTTNTHLLRNHLMLHRTQATSTRPHCCPGGQG
uniref:immunoglobulin superfamily member 1-like n=1 Tax=Pristiophorus japonicus TaxID=55135 RepID=UPI00398E60D0